MSYLTSSKLSTTIDLPIALPATTLKQGDWLVVSTVKLVAPQRLTLQALTFQLLESSASVADIATANKVVANLGLAYVVLRMDYLSGSPGGAGSLDFMSMENLGVSVRTAAPVVTSVPGNYSLIVANNMQAITGVTVPTSTSIDFKVLVTGQFRLELLGA